MLARLRGWFWWRLYALAGRRWERAYDDAHPDQGPTGDAAEYRWVVEDPTYAPVWSAPDDGLTPVQAAVQDGERDVAPSRRDPEQTFIARR